MNENEKKLTTRLSLENLAAELKKKFTSQETELAKAFKSLKVEGNTVSFYTTADKSGTAAATLDFPAEAFLDQNKTKFVDSFAWSEETYPGSVNPNMEGKPVFVLAVAGKTGADSVQYSFVNMATLVDTYKPKTEGKDASTTVEIAGYEVEVKVNISAAEGNQLQLKGDGLYVGAPKVAGATGGNLAGLAADGSLTDSGVAGGEVLTKADISDFTPEEIAAMLNTTSTGE